MERVQIGEAVRVLASDKTGAEWDVVVIAEGDSMNGTKYPAATLEAALPLFEGLPVHAYRLSDPETPYDHMSDEAREATDGTSPILNAVGVLTGCKYGTYTDHETGKKRKGILARLKVSEGFARLRSWMKEAWESGLNSFGFSIDGTGDVEADGTVSRLEAVSELTLVTKPAAGGSGLRLVASLKEGPMLDNILALLKEHAPDLLEGREDADLKESDVLELLGRAVQVAKSAKTAEEPMAPAAPAAPAVPDIDALLANMDEEGLKALAAKVAAMLEQAAAPAAPAAAPEAAPVAASVAEGLLESVQAQLAAVTLERLLGESKLEDLSKDRLRESLAGKVTTEASIREAIEAEAKYVEALAPEKEAEVTDVGAERQDKLRIALDLTFGTRLSESDAQIARDCHIRPFRSISHLFEEMDDERRSIRKIRESHRLVEGLTTSSWAELFADRQHKRLLQEYRGTDSYNLEDCWSVASRTSLDDLRDRRVITLGGFANLDDVTEGSTYEELAMFGDLEETYTPTKRGNVIEVTEESMLQDDLRVITQIPAKLGMAARRTLYEFVWAFFTDNGDFDADSVAWFHASSHGANLLTAALSQDAIEAAALVIFKQAEADSSKRLGLKADTILVPADLYSTALALVKAGGEIGYNADANPSKIREIQPAYDVRRITHWTDTNNWYIGVGASQAETIEIGFVNGNEEPEIFVQDDPKHGARFSADKILYKIRHWYGGAPVDYRTFVRHTVT